MRPLKIHQAIEFVLIKPGPQQTDLLERTLGLCNDDATERARERGIFELPKQVTRKRFFMNFGWTGILYELRAGTQLPR